MLPWAYGVVVQINMDDEDFANLCNMAGEWAARADTWTNHLDVERFEFPGDRPSMKWKRAYWLGEEYTAVILAKSFLADRGYSSDVVWDMSSNSDKGWVILTDYEPPTD